jgi:hypothetical protein
MIYSYQNLSLDPLEGERWKDIPGYEGCYLVSDAGRIQSLPQQVERWMGKNGYISYTMAGRIRKQSLRAEYNPQTKDYNYSLSVSLNKHKVKTWYMVSRLVYAAFIEEIDFEQDGRSVLHRNGDTRDNRLSNLCLADRSERAKDIRRRGRALHDVNDYIDPEKKAAAGRKRRIQVSQYSMDGKLIRVHPSIGMAAAAVGVFQSDVSTALSGKKVSAGGYLWRRGIGEPTISTEAVGQRWNGKRGLMKREQKKLKK